MDKDTFRKKYNPVFYDRNNVYWSKLRKSIGKNKTLSKELGKMLYSENVPYPMYEFNGKKLESLNASSISKASLIEYEPYYHYGDNLSGKLRSSAKLYYQLSLGKKKYKVEIRFKGSFKASPQFQIHEE